MKIAVVAALLAVLLQAKDPSTTKVSIQVKDTTLDQVLKTLTKDTGIPIELDDAAKKEIDPEKEQISVDIKQLNLTDALRLILGPANMDVKVVGKKKVVITPKK